MYNYSSVDLCIQLLQGQSAAAWNDAARSHFHFGRPRDHQPLSFYQHQHGLGLCQEPCQMLWESARADSATHEHCKSQKRRS